MLVIASLDILCIHAHCCFLGCAFNILIGTDVRHVVSCEGQCNADWICCRFGSCVDRAPWKGVADNGMHLDIQRGAERGMRSYCEERSWRQWGVAATGAHASYVAEQLNSCTLRYWITYAGLADTNDVGPLCG